MTEDAAQHMSTLEHALEKFARCGGDAIGYCYSPCEAFWIRLQAGQVTRYTGRVDLCDVFEARVFNAAKELRWVHRSKGSGRVAIVPDGCSENRQPKPFHEHKTIERLLWGSVADTHDGWTSVYSPRYGTAHLPLPGVAKSERVYLRSVEYTVEDQYGNVRVADLRHLELFAKEESFERQR
ncbi:MAG: hypothetical protein CSB46_00895 [Micrococcales bacterium]|nr:MAG: hypothetical protein CSB46_00895 [Micrococcales bacterium]